MDLGGLVQQLGFPVAIAVYFIWLDYKKSKAHLDDIKGVAQQAIAALDKNSEFIEKNTAALGNNNVVLQSAKEAINAHKRNSGV